MATRIAILLALALRGGFSQTAGDAHAPEARVLVGLEQSAAGGAAPVQKLAIDLSFTEPLTPRVAAWGDLRLSSLPRTITSTAATLPADAVKLAVATPVSDLVRSGEFLAGLSYRVSGAGASWSDLMLIASVGATTLLQSTDLPQATGNRFLRQYYAGIRVQSNRQTHVVDVTLGQNEAISSGRLAGAVLRFDGFYALPVASGRFIYLLGTVLVRASPSHKDNDAGRDSYRIGVAVDFLQLLKTLRNN